MSDRGGAEGTDSHGERPADFLPSEDWLEAFAAQCTNALWDSALAYARKRAEVVGTVSDITDSYYVHELVQNAIGDTRRGVLSWDPAARSLTHHIYWAILTRSNHDYEHAKKFRRESLDLIDGDGVLVAEVDAAVREQSSPLDPYSARLARQRWANLRKAAASHASATAILDATEAGASNKQEVMQSAQLSEKEYHAGYVHLTRLRGQVDESTGTDTPRRRKKER
jgi:hypothetical protein